VKKTNNMQKLLMIVLIPLLFASAVLLIITKITDVNIFDKTKELSASLPFVSEPKQKDEVENSPVLEQRVVTLQAEIKEKEAEVFRLQEQLDASEDEKDALLLEQEKLIYEIETLERGADSKKQKLTEIISTFEKMSAKSAAPVIINMSDAEAVQILTNLKPNILAQILEKMPPEEAAKYTTMMTE